jgi:outer membrane protein assembly factor BamB
MVTVMLTDSTNIFEKINPPAGAQKRHVVVIGTMCRGQEQWKFKTEDEVSSSPSLSDGVVYVGSSDGNQYALK